MNSRLTRLQVGGYVMALTCGVAIALGLSMWIAAALLGVVVVAALGTRRVGLLLISWAGVFAVFADRSVIQVSGFGSGLVPIMSLATILLAGLVAAFRPGSLIGISSAIRALATPLVFVLLGSVLPMLGIIVGFPVRTLLSMVPWLTMIAFMFLGAVTSRTTEDFWTPANLLLTLIAWVEFLAGLVQGVSALGGLAGPLAVALRHWDYAVAVRYGIVAVTGRSIGLFINPNVYAVLGGFLFVWAVYVEDLAIMRRVLLIIPSIGIIFLGASRGVILAVVVAVILEQVRRAIESSRPTLQTIGRIVVTIMVAAACMWLAARAAPGLVDRFSGRLSSGVDIFTQGAIADTSASGRIEFWRAAALLFASRPFGTFGPAHMALGSSIDSDYVALLLEGGILFMGLYIATICAMYLGSTRLKNGAVVRSMLLVLAFSSLTQHTLTYSPTMMCVWFLLGATVGGRLSFRHVDPRGGLWS